MYLLIGLPWMSEQLRTWHLAIAHQKVSVPWCALLCNVFHLSVEFGDVVVESWICAENWNVYCDCAYTAGHLDSVGHLETCATRDDPSLSVSWFICDEGFICEIILCCDLIFITICSLALMWTTLKLQRIKKIQCYRILYKQVWKPGS